MVVSNSLLKKIIERSCRSLSYNDEERQFIFPIQIGINDIWENLKVDIQKECTTFYVDDYNRLLARLNNLPNLYKRISEDSIADVQILCGEVLEVELIDDDIPWRLVKMQSGQYLNAMTGCGYCLCDKFVFAPDACLITSDGYRLGIIKSVTMLSPSIEHILLSQVFIGPYYNNKVSDSIWTLFNVSANNEGRVVDTRDCLKMSKSMGINTFTLINILNAGIYVRESQH